MNQFSENLCAIRRGRKCWTIATVVLLAAILFTGCGNNRQNTAYIGEEEAKAIALEQAGVTAEEASFIRMELDQDDGQPVYELEFRAGDSEYEYEIHAETGNVLKAEHDILNRNDGKSGQANQNNQEGTMNQNATNQNTATQTGQ